MFFPYLNIQYMMMEEIKGQQEKTMLDLLLQDVNEINELSICLFLWSFCESFDHGWG